MWNNSLLRYPLSAAAWFDGGRTWTKPKDLAGPTGGRKACYPSCEQAADGALVAIWRQEFPGGWDIRGARFNVVWLLEESTAAKRSPSRSFSK